MERPQKVIAYILVKGHIVVFRHIDQPWDVTGVQVPAGTIEPGELPSDAVLREASEGTGLEGLRIVEYLGVGEYDMRPYSDAVHRRHRFHLTTDTRELPTRWIASEDHDGLAKSERFELYWLPMEQAHVVVVGQAAFLGRVTDSTRGVEE